MENARSCYKLESFRKWYCALSSEVTFTLEEQITLHSVQVLEC